MSAVLGFLFPTPAAGLAWGLVLIGAGVLAQGWVTLVREDRADALVQAQDQAIAMVTETPVRASGAVIPLQRDGGAS